MEKRLQRQKDNENRERTGPEMGEAIEPVAWTESSPR